MHRLTLSFDNGPDPACTPEVLDLLGERGIRASFFVSAQGDNHLAMAAAMPECRKILDRAHGEGHWIGNHTLTHSLELGTTHDILAIDREIGDAQRLLGDLFDDRRLFRPYAGGGVLGPRCFSPEAVDYLCEHGYTVVMFNCVPRDWEMPEIWPEETFRQGERIDWMLLCLHDLGFTGAMRQLPRFLDDCADLGIEFVQDYPADCVPIRGGEVAGSLDGLVCDAKNHRASK